MTDVETAVQEMPEEVTGPLKAIKTLFRNVDAFKKPLRAARQRNAETDGDYKRSSARLRESGFLQPCSKANR